jgi:hypothetical protein
LGESFVAHHGKNPVKGGRVIVDLSLIDGLRDEFDGGRPRRRPRRGFGSAA